MAASPVDLSSLRTLPFFNENDYLESTLLFSQLTPENFCTHGTHLLNGPSVRDCIGATGGVRSLANSAPVYFASQDGLATLSLFHLVLLCEGVLMPHLRPLVTLCEQQGHKGPLSNGGKYAKLEEAKRDLGPAIKFLATHGQAIFSPGALTIGNLLKGFEENQLSKLRNSVAHLNFRLEIERTGIADAPGLPADTGQAANVKRVWELLVGAMGIHNPHKGETVDAARSLVRWEGSLGKPVTKSSSAISIKDVRDMVGRVEAFAFSLAFAFVDAGTTFGSKIVIGVCQTCKEGHVVVLESHTHATCPACGAVHASPRPS